jgi:membrane-associated phospholipid phosphatase
MLVDPTIIPPAVPVTTNRPTGAKMRVMIFVAFFIATLVLDIPISSWVHETGLSAWMKERPWLTLKLRIPGTPPGILLAMLVALFAGYIKGLPNKPTAILNALKDELIVILSALLSGTNVFFKWVIGRIRPFHGMAPYHLQPFKGGWHGQWLAEQNLSFPSGDASLAFALSAGLVMIAPRLRILWISLAAMVAIERVCEGAHYPSDTVAGAALGIVSAILARHLVKVMIKKNWNEPQGLPVQPIDQPSTSSDVIQ